MELADLTLAERIDLLSGADFWHAREIPRVGLPPLHLTDGPSGARGPTFVGARSLSFPCGAALGSTWDTDLVEEVGAALADEAADKGAHVLLGPTINLQRHPLGGRNFESLGEDPRLVANLGAAFVHGVQSRGVAACPKHLVGNDVDAERMSVSVEVDDRTLHEVLLRPFAAALIEAGAWTTMAAYVRLNGTHCAEHPWLLTTLLRDRWGWDGVVVSDWFAAKAPTGVAAGLDLEMPGPALHHGDALASAIEDGTVAEADVDRAAARVWRLRERVGATTGDLAQPRSVLDEARRDLARRAAADACVLVRNEPVRGTPVLPLRDLQRVAISGPAADAWLGQGGGSAGVRPHRPVTIAEGLRRSMGDIDLTIEAGCAGPEVPPPLDRRVLQRPDGSPGAAVTLLDREGATIQPDLDADDLELLWLGRPVSDDFEVRALARLVPDGRHRLTLSAIGTATLRVDGTPVLDTADAEGSGTAFFGTGTPEVSTVVEGPCELEVRYTPYSGAPIAGVRVGGAPALLDDAIARAVAAATTADVAVVAVGTGDTVEGEGGDRASMDLPGDQAELIRAVASANPRTVVVVVSGAPVDTSWADDVAAVVLAPFGGEAMGEAIADVLIGVVEPAGRLACTWPHALADTPAWTAYPPTDGSLPFTEGLFVGHRWYDARNLAVQWPFGHGLGYADVAWESVEPAGPRGVAVTLANTHSEREAVEVVQVYASRPEAAGRRPDRELVAWAKVRLEPGAAREVVVEVPAEALATWDAEAGELRLVPGPVDLTAGRSSRDLRGTVRITV